MFKRPRRSGSAAFGGFLEPGGVPGLLAIPTPLRGENLRRQERVEGPTLVVVDALGARNMPMTG
jgi:hypothetical protein